MKEHYTPDMLQNPVELLRKTQTPDGSGGYTTTEASQGTHHAFVRPVRGGQERQVNDGLSSTVQVIFVMYTAVGVRATDVLVLDGVRYNVRALLPRGVSMFQEIEAESGVVD